MKERALCGPLLMCDKSLIAITSTLPVFACTYTLEICVVVLTIRDFGILITRFVH